LLQDELATQGPITLSSYIQTAHAAGKKVRVDELDSLWDNTGDIADGISNTFASALWGLDILFEFVSVGADGINWHNGYDAGYRLFRFDTKTVNGQKQYTLNNVRPLFYGVQMFSQAISSDSALLQTDSETSGNVKIWATKGSDNAVRIVIINKDEARSGNVQVAVPGYNKGSIQRLQVSSTDFAIANGCTDRALACATNGITLGGQTYDKSADGTMIGIASQEAIQENRDIFSISMPVVSAALVTLRQ
jgi:hypothetical protein